MKAPRSQTEVDAEIAALRAMKPVGRFALKTARGIELSIEALRDQIDETSDEFTVELTDEEQMTAMDAINWKNGDTDERPSEGFGSLVE